MRSKKELRRNPRNKPSVNINKKQADPLSDAVESAIERIEKRHYLGASNQKTNPTGGLNGYYRNLSIATYKAFIDEYGKGKSAERYKFFYPYLMDACIAYTGAGNCSELTGAVYLELMGGHLTAEEKKRIQLRHYPVNNDHQENAYILAGSTVYDIWDNKRYKQSRIRAKTQVDEKKHKISAEIKPDTAPEQIEIIKKSVHAKFSKLFDEQIANDRANGKMYFTFDQRDTDEYALRASDTIPHLFNKFKETVEDAYFLENQGEATTIQEKILKDYVYLIEELRQDFPASGIMENFHLRKIQYSAKDIEEKMKGLIPHPLFVDFILAISYQNSAPQKALELLTNVQDQLSSDGTDSIEKCIAATIPLLIATLTQATTSSSTDTANHQNEESVDVCSSLLPVRAITTHEPNTQQFFAGSFITNTVESTEKEEATKGPGILG